MNTGEIKLNLYGPESFVQTDPMTVASTYQNQNINYQTIQSNESQREYYSGINQNHQNPNGKSQNMRQQYQQKQSASNERPNSRPQYGNFRDKITQS